MFEHVLGTEASAILRAHLVKHEFLPPLINKIVDANIEAGHAALLGIKSDLSPEEFKIQHTAISYDIKRMQQFKELFNQFITTGDQTDA